MEIADRIVVTNHGRVEQANHSRALYERPVNAFVMSFIGPVVRLDERFIRPHEITLLDEPDTSTEEAVIDRVVQLGFEVRVGLILRGGRPLWVQITHGEARERRLEPGQTVFVSLGSGRVFDPVGTTVDGAGMG